MEKVNSIQRSFIIGDDWLYFKIYCGAKTSDFILTDVIKPLTEYLISNNHIKYWFFIRYSDPKPHLRVRFFIEDKECYGKVISEINKALKEYIQNDIIWNVQVDTYNREIERYGNTSMVVSEKLFYYESDLIVNFLDLIEGETGEELRWLFSLRAMDCLLNAFKMNNENKLALLDRLKTQFGNEFGMNKHLNKQLDVKYRKAKNKIENFMILTKNDNTNFNEIFALLDYKTIASKNAIESILMLEKQNKLEVNFNNLMSSYLHMLMNRLFRSRNRMHEMVCYNFLFKYYKAIVARSR